MKKCDNCGVEATDLNLVVGRGEYCRNCFNERTFKCAHCDVVFDRSDGFYALGYDISVCTDCGDVHYVYCDCCERWVNRDDYNLNGNLCWGCYYEEADRDYESDNESEYIGDYHDTDFDFFGEAKKSENLVWRGVGIELEIDRKNFDFATQESLCRQISKKTSRVVFETDGSLENGFEIISHPHTLKAFKEIDWKFILDSCKSHLYKSHDTRTCGLHIHFSRTFFGATENLQNLALSKIIYFYDKWWDSIFKLSRRTENQVHNWARKEEFSNKGDIKKLIKNKENNNRYNAINLKNKDTIEFRLGRGTLNFESFSAWIDFSIKICQNSKKISWKNIDNIELWLKNLEPNTIQYMQSKAIDFEQTEVA